MGFTSGFVSPKSALLPFTWLIQSQAGGVTVTLGVAYITVLAHERNRHAQAQALRSQSRVLQTLLEPDPTAQPRSRAELVREERSTFTETAKDRWNEEVSNAVRWVQTKDWSEVRESFEDSVAKLWSGGLQKSREGIEDAESQARPTVQEAIEKTRAAGKSGIDAAASGIDRAAAAAISSAEKVGSEAKQGARRIAASSKEQVLEVAYPRAERAVADTKSGAHDAASALRNTSGTVDAARSAVRGAISKGIEKGKEVFGKAQSAITGAEERIESKTREAALSSPSAIENALQERYQKRPEQSVEEALAERYKPIDAKDKTVLRGV